MSNLKIDRTLIIKAIVTIATAILGGAFVTTGILLPAGVGLLASVSMSSLVAVFTGFGGYTVTDLSIEALKGDEGAKVLFVITVVIAVVGALVGFFVSGGAFAVIAAALYAVSAESALAFGLSLIIEPCIAEPSSESP